MFGFGKDVNEQMKKSPIYLLGWTSGFVTMGVVVAMVIVPIAWLEESSLSELAQLGIFIPLMIAALAIAMFVGWAVTVWIYRSSRDSAKWREKYPDWTP